jgi:hypothetical protein
MTLLSPLATTVITAIVGWLAYQFLAKPLNRFFEIRSAVFSILAKYNDPPPGEEGGAAKQEFLGAAMDLRGFAGSESFISGLLGFCRHRTAERSIVARKSFRVLGLGKHGL